MDKQKEFEKLKDTIEKAKNEVFIGRLHNFF